MRSPAINRTSSILHDPVGRALLRMTVPTTLGVVSMLLFYLADTYYLSLLGTAPLAAIGFAMPATIMVSYLGVGIGIGTTALTAHALGADAHEDARSLVMQSLLLALVIGALLILPAMLSIDALFGAMGAEGEVLGLIRAYLSIWYLGAPLLLAQFATTAVLRASGEARLHGIMLAAGAGINAVLDPLFIFGPGPLPALGIAGAAVANVLTWVITVGIICYVLSVKKGLLSWQWPAPAQLLQGWYRHLRISFPAACANMITPLATGIITATLAGYGVKVVAAISVTSRIEQLALIVILGMTMSLPPFLSQNFGARKFDRVDEGLRLSLRFALVWQLAVYALLALAAPLIARIYTSDPEVIATIRTVLWILPLSFGFQAMTMLAASSFNALHAPRQALMLSFARFFVFYVPGALVGEAVGGVAGLFVGAALGNVGSGLFAARWVLRHAAALQR